VYRKPFALSRLPFTLSLRIKSDPMSEIVNQSLQKIAKGTGIIFIGTIISMFLGFINRVIVVRYITQSEYGIYSLGLVLFSIFTTISFLGLHQGTPRYIAFYRGKKDEKKVKEVAYFPFVYLTKQNQGEYIEMNKVNFLLYEIKEVYRSLHLWVDVT